VLTYVLMVAITFTAGSIMTDSMKICCVAGRNCRGFDRTRIQYGGVYSDSMVDGVLAVLRVLPIYLLNIMYWAMYAQVWPFHDDGCGGNAGG
jgi:hypothetical protein